MDHLLALVERYRNLDAQVIRATQEEKALRENLSRAGMNRDRLAQELLQIGYDILDAAKLDPPSDDRATSELRHVWVKGYRRA